MSDNILEQKPTREELKMKLRAKILGTSFSRLPKDAKDVRIENVKTRLEQTIATMKENNI